MGRTVTVSGVWLRTEDGRMIVAVEQNGEWVDVIDEEFEVGVSHAVYPSGMERAGANVD